ncbi:MAG: helix-turn-helix transcriptional regulator [Acetatifactor muris]|nr:helix-turn-helix transcriptional regulator [Acetatifactor muris]
MYNATEIATKINQILKEKQLSQKDMLEKCGLSKNAISSMLSRGSMLRADNLAKIADYLDCSIDYLMGRNHLLHKESLSNNLAAKYSSLPKDAKEEIAHMINYKYEQYQKKRMRLSSSSESPDDKDSHNMLA